MTRTIATRRQDVGSTIEPSRAWIVGLTVGSDGRLEWHGPIDGGSDASPGGPASGGLTSGGLACECPDDCPRDHPNE